MYSSLSLSRSSPHSQKKQAACALDAAFRTRLQMEPQRPPGSPTGPGLTLWRAQNATIPTEQRCSLDYVVKLLSPGEV